MLEVSGVTKSFGTNRVLAGIDLQMQEHSVVCLIGASGSGKSTLLRCINGLESIDSGSILVGGIPVVQEEESLNRLRRVVGIVFQSFNLFPHMTVLQNVTLAPRQVLKLSAADADARAYELLARIGLTEKSGDYPDRLSGGQQQRVAIVRALAMQPRLLLLDEITSALDPALVGEVLDLVRELASEGMTLLLATHQMGFARQV
ncbi:MAG: amino acid ABC transporter ATP-binding protein, partial [Actinomycetota bacterium]